MQVLKAAAAALYKFNKGIIDAVCDIVPAVKPQAAYYEMYGYYGVKALYKTIKYAQSKGMYVIVDGKRNDIGATMDAYSAAYLGSTEVYGERIAPFGAGRSHCKRISRHRRNRACSQNRRKHFRSRKDLQQVLRRASGQTSLRWQDHLRDNGRYVREVGRKAAWAATATPQ